MNKLSSLAALASAALIAITPATAWSNEATPGWYPPPGQGGYAQPWHQPSQWSAPQRGYGQWSPQYPQRAQSGTAPAAPAPATAKTPAPAAKEIQLSAELKQAQEQLTAKTTQLDMAHAQREQLRGTLQYSLEAERALSEQLAQITGEHQYLQLQVSELTAALNTTTAMLERQRQQVTLAQEQNWTLTAERDRLHDELASRDVHLAIMQDDLQAAAQAREQAQSETSAIEQQLSSARTQAEMSSNELSELNAELQTQNSRLANAVHTRTAERDRLRSDVAGQDVQLATMQAELQAAAQALEQAQSETSAIEQQLGAARAQAGTFHNELSQLNTELETQKSRLVNAVHARTAERDRLRSETASRDVQLAAVQAELQAATQALQEAQSETFAFEQQLGEAREQAGAFHSELRELDAVLEARQTMLRDTQQALAAVTAERDGLQADLAACSQELTRAQAAMTSAQSALEALHVARAAAAGDVVPPSPGGPDATTEPAAGAESNAAATEVAALQTATTDTDADGVTDGIDLCPGTQQDQPVDSTGCAAGVAIKLEGVNFLDNSQELTDAARGVLDRVAGVISQHPELRLEVAGHTDAAGDPSYNQWLSMQRAEAVRKYLVAQGVNPEHIGAAGYGGQRPIADNTTSEGLQKNRRVELRRQQ